MDTLVITQQFKQANIKDFGYVYKDSQHAINFEEVKNLEDSFFLPLKKTGLSFSPSKHVHWIKFHLKNEATVEQTFILETVNHRINQLCLFLTEEGHLISDYKLLGDNFPFYERELIHQNFLFEIRIPQKTVYSGYIFNDKFLEGIDLSYTLYSATQFEKIESQRSIYLPIYLGVLFFIAVFAILLAIFISNRFSIYLAIYIAAMFLLRLSRTGLGFKLIWFDYPYFNSISGSFFIILSTISIIALTRSYFRTKSIMPKWDRLLQFIQLSHLGYIPYLFFYRLCLGAVHTVVIYIGYSLQAFCFISIIGTIIFGYLKFKNRNYLFFLGAIIFALFAMLTHVFIQLKILESSYQTELFLHLSFLLDICILLILVIKEAQDSFVQNQKLSVQLNEVKVHAATSLMRGQQTEQQKLSQELDSKLSSKLNLTKQSLAELKRNDEPEISALIIEIELLSKELSSFSQEINPLDLQKESLIKAIGGLIEKINQINSSINISFKDSYIEKTKLSDLKSHAIFLSTQELINNALKYAKASIIEVQLKQVNNRLFLSVQDNGKGFDVTKKTEGIGLKNIKNRATFFNGKFEVESDDSGSNFRFEIPISD